MYLKDLLKYAKEKIIEHPELKSQILDFYQLACDESEDECESEAHEVQLAISDIDNLIKIQKN